MTIIPHWLTKHSVMGHLQLALPLCLVHLGQQFMAMVDIAMLGNHSKTALAGAGIGANYVFVVQIVCAGFLLSLDATIPKAVGQDNQGLAWTIYRKGLKLAFFFTLPATLIILLGPFIVNGNLMTPAIANEFSSYVYPRMLGTLPYLLFYVQRSFLQANNNTRPIVYVIVLANVLNLLLDALFIHGDGALAWLGMGGIGVPAMGSFGAGLATSLVSLFSVFFLGLFIKKPTNGSHSQRFSSKTLMIIGLPIAGQLLIECGIFGLTGFLSGLLGETPAAAHQIALSIASLSFASALGMATATAVRVGHNLGKGNPSAAKDAGWVGIFLGTLIMAASGLLFILAPEFLTGFFSRSNEILNLANKLLLVAALFQLSDAVQVIAAGALRGAGVTKPAFYSNLIGHYLFGLPIGLFLAFRFDFGAVGLWWGLSGGLTLVAIILLVVFKQAFKSIISGTSEATKG